MRFRIWIGAGMIPVVAMIALACNGEVTAPVAPTVGSIVLQLEADTLSVHQTTQLRAAVLSVDGDTLTDEALTFLSSDDDIVTVTPLPSHTGLVTAEGSGTATVTAQAGSRSATITVYVRRAASISIMPSNSTLLVDDTLRLTATVLDADGAPVEQATVRWIEEFDVPVLSAFDIEGFSGGFNAVGVGNEVITAETEGLTATFDVTVNPSEVGSVILSPDSLTVAVGGTARVTVVVRDTTGAVIADPNVVISCGGSVWGVEAVCLKSNDTLVAAIDPTGLVTGFSTTQEERIEVIARYKGVNSNVIYLRVGIPDSSCAGCWDY